MEREIKFRLYHRPLKLMFWFDLRWGTKKSLGAGWLSALPISEEERGWGTSDRRQLIDPMECDILQYTGFHDKNGKEIYEGDILKYHDGTDVAHYKIYWDEKQAKFFDTRLEDGDSQTNYDGFEFVKDCKVIGNIYETPELLRAVGG